MPEAITPTPPPAPQNPAPSIQEAQPAAPGGTLAVDQTPGVDQTTATIEQNPNETAVAKRPPPSFFEQYGLIIVAVAFWFVWIWMSRKNKARRKQEEERLSSIKKGDRVITIGRMHGIVVAFTDDTVTLLTDAKNGAVMIFDRVAIYKILPRNGEETPDKKDA